MTDAPPLRVLRVIARLNMGGPAHHVSILSGDLDPERYRTLLVAGRVGAGEAELTDIAAARGVQPTVVPGLHPEIVPADEARATAELIRIVRCFRPHIVHTHTAKAGMLGRIAAVLGIRPRPIVLHTYHGHVLEGYFDPARERLFRAIERGLARVTDRLIGVSQATVDDLVRLRIAPRQRFSVVPLGLDLDRFLSLSPAPDPAARKRLGLGKGELVLTFVGRLVRIKRVDVLLRAVASAQATGASVRLLIVGDGELADEHRALARELGVEARFLGYRRDLDAIMAATDVAILGSDNEGTPVALIEAAAAARPLVATDVGGVRDVVRDGVGILVPRNDHEQLGAALVALANDPERRAAMGLAARVHVRKRYSAGRLVADVDALYRELLQQRAWLRHG